MIGGFAPAANGAGLGAGLLTPRIRRHTLHAGLALMAIGIGGMLGVVARHPSSIPRGHEREAQVMGKHERGELALAYGPGSPEINALLLRINHLVQARELLRKQGGGPAEIEVMTAEIARLQWRLAAAVRRHPPNRDAAA